jgi:hypothetical protein
MFRTKKKKLSNSSTPLKTTVEAIAYSVTQNRVINIIYFLLHAECRANNVSTTIQFHHQHNLMGTFFLMNTIDIDWSNTVVHSSVLIKYEHVISWTNTLCYAPYHSATSSIAHQQMCPSLQWQLLSLPKIQYLSRSFVSHIITTSNDVQQQTLRQFHQFRHHRDHPWCTSQRTSQAPIILQESLRIRLQLSKTYFKLLTINSPQCNQ